VQALYAKDVDKATALSSIAQSESAKHFADFIFTVFSLSDSDGTSISHVRDLREYPYVSNSVDMLYRYQPIVDASLVPYSGGKMVPLALRKGNGKIENVQGLGMVPSLAPPFSDDHVRISEIEYFLVPGAYKEFSAEVGLNPLFEESMPSAEFAIFGDGELLAQSKIFQPGDKAMKITAQIGETRFLTLRMRYAHTQEYDVLNTVSSHLAWVSHGVWANPELK
jgi:hypothetical protein